MKNVSLGVKLVGGFILAALITLGVGIHDYLGIERMKVGISNLSDRSIPGLEYITSVEALVQEVRASVNFLLGQEATKEERVAFNARTPQLIEEATALLDKTSKLSPLAKRMTDELLAALNPWGETIFKMLRISEEVVAADEMYPDYMLSVLYALEVECEKMMRQAKEFAFLGSSSLEFSDNAMKLLLAEMNEKSAHSQALVQNLVDKDQALHTAVDAIKQAALSGDMDRARALFPAAELAGKEWKESFIPIRDNSLEVQKKFIQLKEIAGKEGAEARGVALKKLDETVKEVTQAAENYATETEEIAVAVERRALIIAGCAVVLSILIGLLLTRAITAPLHKSVALAQALANGDLTQDLDVHQQDEVGKLAAALNEMVIGLRRMMGDVNKEVLTVTSSAESLAGISAQVTEGATTTAERARQVAAASEEMSANQSSIAAAMEEASINVNTVATATEEMSATIGEIAANSGKARDITSQAVRQAKNSSERVHELGAAANEINKVTEAITAISSQTNLLALNATIEAARAGEAGRGFAVVANEIKELAQQTARSTEEIQHRIQDIQQATQLAVGEINQISGIVGEVDDIVSTIAAAVEEQSVTTRDIAGNVGQASLGLTEVNTNVNESSVAAREIASDVADVTVRANEMLVSSEQVKMSATELATTAETLRTLVAQFKLKA